MAGALASFLLVFTSSRCVVFYESSFVGVGLGCHLFASVCIRCVWVFVLFDSQDSQVQLRLVIVITSLSGLSFWFSCKCVSS